MDSENVWRSPWQHMCGSLSPVSDITGFRDDPLSWFLIPTLRTQRGGKLTHQLEPLCHQPKTRTQILWRKTLSDGYHFLDGAGLLA